MIKVLHDPDQLDNRFTEQLSNVTFDIQLFQPETNKKWQLLIENITSNSKLLWSIILASPHSEQIVSQVSSKSPVLTMVLIKEGLKQWKMKEKWVISPLQQRSEQVSKEVGRSVLFYVQLLHSGTKHVLPPGDFRPVNKWLQNKRSFYFGGEIDYLLTGFKGKPVFILFRDAVCHERF